ncbi:MAG: hypothetical protein JWM85_2557 [Acidimicrobiaceae bacterium]|nr:hypothetical protein [Acidimicrobiaceae bacterium]
MRWPRFLIPALLALGSSAGILGASGSNATPASAATTPHEVGLAKCTFIDPSRTTTDYSVHPPVARSGRLLTVEIRYPTVAGRAGATETRGVAPEPQVGGYPTVVFAHGFAVSPDTYRALLDSWVRAGFVVVAPVFPDDNGATVAAEGGAASGIEDDLVNEPADLAFVTRQVLSASAKLRADCRIAHGLIEPTALALAGQSDGAQAAGMLAYDSGSVAQTRQPYSSLRAGLTFRAAILMSGAPDETDPYGTSPTAPAMLVVQSATDQCNPPQFSDALYNDVHQADKWFLELLHAQHLPPYDGADPQAFAVVARVTTRFLRLEMKGLTPAVGFVNGFGDAVPSVAHMLTGPVAPALSEPFSVGACYAP